MSALRNNHAFDLWPNALLVAAAFGWAGSPTTAAAETTSEASCKTYLSTSPSPAGLTALTGPGGVQRAAMLADSAKIVTIGSRYYVVWIPPAYYTAPNPIVILDLHGTGGYPEAEWNDWHSSLAARGYAFIGLAWGGGTLTAESDQTIYSQFKQILDEVGAECPINSAKKWLMGFSVGSATSFAVLIRDVADKKLFRGQIAVSGAAASPLITGKDVMNATVESNRSNLTAMQGIDSWMYCGEMDFDHGWSMCEEMPNGESFVNTHGGSATLYKDAFGTHASLPTTSAAKDSMFAYIESAITYATPTNGWWWNPQENGRGFSIEVSGSNLAMATFIYDASGRSTWYLSAGPLNADGSYHGPLSEFTGGQTLTGIYVAPAVKGNVSDVTLSCLASTRCTLDWVGGTVPIERFVWDEGAKPATAPETGWWWNAEESGRGYFLEMQGNTLGATAYMYDAAGNALWYLLSAAANGSTVQGQWSQFANGQTLTGSYVAPIVANDNVGPVTIQFASPSSAVLTLPQGRQIPIERFRF